MLGAIFGALAGATAAVAHKASEAVEEVGERAGIPKWITGGISGGLAAIGDGAAAAKDMQFEGLGTNFAMIGDSVRTTLGSVFGSDSSTTIMSVAKVEPAAEVAVSAPTQKNTQLLANVQEACRGDLCTFSAPTFSKAPLDVGTREV